MTQIKHYTDLPKDMLQQVIADGFTRYRISDDVVVFLRKDGPPAAIIHSSFNDELYGLQWQWTRRNFSSDYQMRKYVRENELTLDKSQPLPMVWSLRSVPHKLVKKALGDGFTNYRTGQGEWIRLKHGATANPVTRVRRIVLLERDAGLPAAIIKWHTVDLYTVPDEYVRTDFTSRQELRDFLREYKVTLEARLPLK